MDKAIIQVPVDKKLRDQAASAASSLGFSSLQETIRLFLHKLATRELTFSFEEPSVQLSPRAARRYDKMVRDIESGKEPVYTASSTKDLLDQLYGRKRPVLKKIP